MHSKDTLTRRISEKTDSLNSSQQNTREEHIPQTIKMVLLLLLIILLSYLRLGKSKLLYIEGLMIVGKLRVQLYLKMEMVSIMPLCYLKQKKTSLEELVHLIMLSV